MPKFEAKKEILQKFGKNWGGGGVQPPFIFGLTVVIDGLDDAS